MNRPYRFLISGGGTGGHIFPALSIAGALRRRFPDCEILFVGAEGRMEMERVPAAGYEIKGLPVMGFNRHNLLANFRVVYHLWKSLRMARRIVRDFAPDMAIGVGGYASGPVLKQAQKAGIPTLLQEQNSYPGVTNKMLARKADAICVAYSDTDRFFPADKIHLTGNPVRRAILDASSISKADARRELGLLAEGPVVLVVGGSLGARTVNASIEAALPALAKAGIFTLWQTGRYYAEATARVAAQYPESVRATAFVDRMDLAYRAADLVVSRAGAGTISELQLLGKPSILVPSPNVAEDHQRKNAEALAMRGAAIMILDAEATERLGHEIISLVADTPRLNALGANIAAMALPDADTAIVDRICQILNRKEK